jgi:hypothetical protein
MIPCAPYGLATVVVNGDRYGAWVRGQGTGPVSGPASNIDSSNSFVAVRSAWVRYMRGHAQQVLLHRKGVRGVRSERL